MVYHLTTYPVMAVVKVGPISVINFCGMTILPMPIFTFVTVTSHTFLDIRYIYIYYIYDLYVNKYSNLYVCLFNVPFCCFVVICTLGLVVGPYILNYCCTFCHNTCEALIGGLDPHRASCCFTTNGSTNGKSVKSKYWRTLLFSSSSKSQKVRMLWFGLINTFN